MITITVLINNDAIITKTPNTTIYCLKKTLKIIAQKEL